MTEFSHKEAQKHKKIRKDLYELLCFFVARTLREAAKLSGNNHARVASSYPDRKSCPAKKSIVSGGCHEFKELDILA